MSKENISSTGEALKKMQEIAQEIYNSTPAIHEDMPRHTSKILQNVKLDKKQASRFYKSTSHDIPSDFKYEDWQTKYSVLLQEYIQAKDIRTDLNQSLSERQERYIHRE